MNISPINPISYQLTQRAQFNNLELKSPNVTLKLNKDAQERTCSVGKFILHIFSCGVAYQRECTPRFFSNPSNP